MATEPAGGATFDFVLIVGPGVILAVAAIVLAWLKWRHPKDKGDS